MVYALLRASAYKKQKSTRNIRIIIFNISNPTKFGSDKSFVSVFEQYMHVAQCPKVMQYSTSF